MKYISKIICVILLITCCSITFGMLRRVLNPSQSRQLSRMAQARTLATSPAVAPKEHTSIQQKWAEIKIAGQNTWNKLRNIFSNTPVAAPHPQSVSNIPLAPTTHMTSSTAQAALETDLSFLLINIEKKLNKPQ